MRIIGQQWAHSKPLLSWNRTQAAETCPSQGIKPLTGNYNWKEQPQSWFSTYSLRSSCCRSNHLFSKEVFLRTRNKWPGAKNYHNGAKFWPKVANKGIQKNGAFLSITDRVSFFSGAKLTFYDFLGGSKSFFKRPSREIISVFCEYLFQSISTDGPLWQLSSWLYRFESRRQKYLEDVVYLNLTWFSCCLQCCRSGFEPSLL